MNRIPSKNDIQVGDIFFFTDDKTQPWRITDIEEYGTVKFVDNTKNSSKSFDSTSKGERGRTTIKYLKTNLDNGSIKFFPRDINEQLRMQVLAGIITESEYKAKLEEQKKPKSKKSLNENFVGIGAINNPFPEREKTDYELAFDHYMGNINEADGEFDWDEQFEIGDKVVDRSGIKYVIIAKQKDPIDNKTYYIGEHVGTGDQMPLYRKDIVKKISLSENEEGVEDEENPIDAITMDVPLFIRMLEFAREDASTDMDLHDLADKAIAMSTEGEMLSMDNYEDLVGAETSEEN
jgi:hypothetical protein